MSAHTYQRRVRRVAPLPAFLFGSHYFGTARPDSDIDCLATDSAEARARLRRAGFVLVYLANPASNQATRAVYESADDPPIHVALVSDVRRKLRVQQAMHAAGLGELLRDKNLAPKLWNFGLRLVP